MVRELGLTKSNAELLATLLRERNLTDPVLRYLSTNNGILICHYSTNFLDYLTPCLSEDCKREREYLSVYEILFNRICEYNVFGYMKYCVQITETMCLDNLNMMFGTDLTSFAHSDQHRTYWTDGFCPPSCSDNRGCTVYTTYTVL